ncbi:MAG: hypothetical protein HYY37_06330 [Candidatus Aenigmarchaeota archaeon]|nr:hypothetical protein [Candidatus Aenigmarchaeota archaeon]
MVQRSTVKRASYLVAFLSGIIFSNAVGSFLLGEYAIALLSLMASGFGIQTVSYLRDYYDKAL